MYTSVKLHWPLYWGARKNLYDRIVDWCNEICEFEWKWHLDPEGRWVDWPTHVCFDNPEDATMFKLAFPI